MISTPLHAMGRLLLSLSMATMLAACAGAPASSRGTGDFGIVVGRADGTLIRVNLLVARIPVAGQPVFVMAQPDGRQVWVNFALAAHEIDAAVQGARLVDTRREVLFSAQRLKQTGGRYFAPAAVL